MTRRDEMLAGCRAVRRTLRRYRISITVLAVCVAVGTWTIVTGHVYHGPVQWWRLVIAGAAGAAGVLVYERDRRRHQ